MAAVALTIHMAVIDFAIFHILLCDDRRMVGIPDIGLMDFLGIGENPALAYQPMVSPREVTKCIS